MSYSVRADVLRVSGISSNDLSEDNATADIAEADLEIEEWTGKKWESTTATEYFPGKSEKITSTDSVKLGQFYTETEEDRYIIMLSNYPVISVTSLQFLDDDGTVDSTLTENTDFHVWTDTGKIRLITNPIPTGRDKKKIKVVYNYGYTAATVSVRELSATIAAIKALVRLTGGSYDDITSYSLGPLSVGVGEPYMNMRAAVRELEIRKMQLLNMIGRSFRMVII